MPMDGYKTVDLRDKELSAQLPNPPLQYAFKNFYYYFVDAYMNGPRSKTCLE